MAVRMQDMYNCQPSAKWFRPAKLLKDNESLDVLNKKVYSFLQARELLQKLISYVGDLGMRLFLRSRYRPNPTICKSFIDTFNKWIESFNPERDLFVNAFLSV